MTGQGREEEPAAEFRPRFLRGFLRGTYNHFSARVDRLPWLLERLLWIFFSKIEIREKDRERIRKAAKRGTIIYAPMNPSRLEFLFLSLRLRREGLPYPVFGHYLTMIMFQPLVSLLRWMAAIAASLIYRGRFPNPYRDGYVERMLQGRETMCLFLRQFRGLPRRIYLERKDPLAAIIQDQQRLEVPIRLVPVMLVYGKRPLKETTSLVDLLLGSREAPGRLRSLAIFLLHYRRAVVRVLEPMDLGALVEKKSKHVSYSRDRMEDIAYRIRRECLDRIAKERKIVLGRTLKPRSEIIEEVIHDPDLVNRVLEHCRETGQDFVEARREVRGYLEEIAADHDQLVINLLDRFLTWMWKKLYSGIVTDEEGLERITDVAREIPVIYIPCHKSHMDYLLLSYVLYHHHVHLPNIAAGINLNFWPLGPIFRRCGAFFLRRSFKGLSLYPVVFSKYMQKMIEEGATIEFFVEGGRSRTGKIIVPKLGFLSIVLDAVRKSRMPDLAFVPISISYEGILEESFYIREQSGQPKEKENFTTMLRHRRLIARRQGSVYMDFARPLTLREIMERKGLKRIPSSRERAMELAGEIAYNVVYRINEVSRATPYSVVAAAVLSTTRRGILLKEIRQRSEMLHRYLVSRGVRFTENIERVDDWVEAVLDDMEAKGVVSTDREEPVEEEERVFTLNEDKRLHLCLYKNGIVHHFQFPAMLSICFLNLGVVEGRQELADAFARLRDVLRLEFVYTESYHDSPELAEKQFDEAFEYFTGRGLVDSADGRFLLTREGEGVARVYASLISSFIESYYIVARAVRKHEPRKMPEKEILRLALKKADRLFSIGEVWRMESKNKLIFETALKFLCEKGVLLMEYEIEREKKAARVYTLQDAGALEELISHLDACLENTP